MRAVAAAKWRSAARTSGRRRTIPARPAQQIGQLVQRRARAGLLWPQHGLGLGQPCFHARHIGLGQTPGGGQLLRAVQRGLLHGHLLAGQIQGLRGGALGQIGAGDLRRQRYAQGAKRGFAGGLVGLGGLDVAADAAKQVQLIAHLHIGGAKVEHRQLF
jgi:hypothetical protein